MYGDSRRRVDRLDIRQWTRDIRNLSRIAEDASGRRVDRVLRSHGGILHRISVVQRAPRGSVHGRRRIARPGRGDWHNRRHDQAGASASIYWGSVRDRSDFRDFAGWLLQVAQETHLQDGSPPSSLRIDGLVGIQDYCPLLDCITGIRTVRADDSEIEMTFRPGFT